MALRPPKHGCAALIEAAAADALAADTEVRLDGWRLRFGGGDAKRSHSALPERAGRMPLEQRLSAVQAFYRDRGRPARVQVAPAAAPTGLDDALAHAGWLWEAGALVLVRDLEALPSDPQEAPGSSVSAHDPDGFAAVCRAADPDRAAWNQARLPRLLQAGRTVRTPVLRQAGAPVAAALVAHEPAAALAGVFAFAVVPDARRRGFGRSLLAALLHQASRNGAESVYLQVAERQQAALRLYRGAGFETHHAYHYRRAPDGA